MNYQKLFDYISQNYGINLLESEMQEICNIVNEIQKEANECQNKEIDSVKSDISEQLPMYDVEELNEIIKLFNDKKLDSYNLIARVWNKAYLIGVKERTKTGSLGN